MFSLRQGIICLTKQLARRSFQFYPKNNMATNKFLKVKALANILVNFAKTTKPEDDIVKQVFKNICEAVTDTYGENRFAVYNVSENELKIDSKSLSAILLIVVAGGKMPDKDLPSIDNVPRLKLDIDQLYEGQFNRKYFTDNITQMISLEDYRSSEDVAAAADIEDDQLYVFDTFNQLKPGSNERNSKLIYIDVSNNKNEQQKVKLPYFDVGLYWRNLRTRYMGRSMVFAHRMATTMDIASKYQHINGFVAICNYQTCGIGRNNNKWLSPIGCAMFTINLNITLGGTLPRISLVQHIASLSVVMAMPSDRLNVRIKWPNDIVYGESMSKVAGILVRSISSGKTINIQIGIGINLANTQPSLCLNDIIDFYNENNPPSSRIEHMSKEVLISNILNNFEELLVQLESNNLDTIRERYCASWIHSGAEVTIEYPGKDGQQQPVRRQGCITGIDENGYLLAKDLETEETLALQPDGNRFDLMRQLVIIDSRD